MPSTRRKVIKTVYKDEESEEETGDYSDSGSDAQISEPPSSDEEDIDETRSSADEFDTKSNRRQKQKKQVRRKPKFAKEFINKITKQIEAETVEPEICLPEFSVKNLTDADKLLPSVLNLSESDSSDDETPKKIPSKKAPAVPYSIPEENDSEDENKGEYTDIWTSNIHDNSAEIAKKTFMELEKHKSTIEETKASLQSYVHRTSVEQSKESNVTDLLALGEEVTPQKSPIIKKKRKGRVVKDDSDSEVEDWEEVKESKAIPQQGLQLIVELPDCVSRKTKKIDVEMMMKRKINRVKKEHQVFMHKVHVLSWIGHGNYVSPVLNDQEIMAAVIAMVPKGCYPDNRLNMKYVEQITEWFKDKFSIKQDKHENKFKPKAPPLRNILLDQIKGRVVTAKKYLVYIYVAMLRALGLQCRVMFNFVTVPLKPLSSELCSLAIKPKDDKSNQDENKIAPKRKPSTSSGKTKSKAKLPQVDGIYDSFSSSDNDFEQTMDLDDFDFISDDKFGNIMQVDGNDDAPVTKVRPVRSTRAKKVVDAKSNIKKEDEDDSPPKRSKIDLEPPAISTKAIAKNKSAKKSVPSKSSQRKKTDNEKGDSQNVTNNEKEDICNVLTSPKSLSLKKPAVSDINNGKEDMCNVLTSPKSLSLKKLAVSDTKSEIENNKTLNKLPSPRKTRSNSKTDAQATTSVKPSKTSTTKSKLKDKSIQPKIILTDENGEKTTPSKYFQEDTKVVLTRKRSRTAEVNDTKNSEVGKGIKAKTRARSAAGSVIEKSKYFDEFETNTKKPKLNIQQVKNQEKIEDAQRVSHKDLIKPRRKPKNDVTDDLVNIIKDRIKGAKEEAKKGIVKGKVKEESDDDSDYLPVEDPKRHNSESDQDFKPTKISPKGPKKMHIVKQSTSKKRIDRRVLSSDDEVAKQLSEGDNKKVDVWCEIFVEELEQWVAVDVVKGKVHCTGDLYSHATHPVCYVIGWDNNNYLKDLTRRYVPHWNTVTRKQRAEAQWWRTAVQPWLGPRNARDREEDEALDRMQLEAPLPKSIAEYKNHPLYALKRHLLKFEAIYPEDAQTLGFVRNEAVYARECVYVCRSRDTWLKEAKVVKMGEKPYKVVKARPKWDKLSNKLITDKPLEVFGPWQVQDYEPPTAENGRVPRNAYGNVELFKECMLPKGTVHIKLPGLNKVARKLNIDCAPAMTGFDFNGGWSHPVYDGFVVCKEFEEDITEAWLKDQEEQERKEREKIELRIYGNWKRLIKGLLIRERLKYKYGFEKPTTSEPSKSKKGPRLVVKKT